MGRGLRCDGDGDGVDGNIDVDEVHRDGCAVL